MRSVARLLAAVRVLTVLVLAANAAPGAALDRNDLTIATTPAGTIFFSIGGGMARVLQDELHVHTSPRPYGSPSRCLPLLNRDDVALALVSSIDAARAYAGLTPYPGANSNVRLIARVMPLMNGYFVRADSPFHSIADIRGARMVYEIRGSHAQTLLADAVLATAGLTRDDIVPFAAAHVVESIDALIDGRVDVAMSALGTAASQRANASIGGGIRALALGPEASDEFMRAHMAGARTAIAKPGPAMAGVAAPTLVAAYDTYLATNTAVSDADAYAIATTLIARWEQLQRDYPALRAVSTRDLVVPDTDIPYHPGALRAYREHGLWRRQ
jgi:TRAP transporter TAXI family solute receptor